MGGCGMTDKIELKGEVIFTPGSYTMTVQGPVSGVYVTDTQELLVTNWVTNGLHYGHFRPSAKNEIKHYFKGYLFAFNRYGNREFIYLVEHPTSLMKSTIKCVDVNKRHGLYLPSNKVINEEQNYIPVIKRGSQILKDMRKDFRNQAQMLSMMTPDALRKAMEEKALTEYQRYTLLHMKFLYSIDDTSIRYALRELTTNLRANDLVSAANAAAENYLKANIQQYRTHYITIINGEVTEYDQNLQLSQEAA
jgi:DNA-dependent RNA polymerase auxiliary subunit epsilon